MPSADGGTAVQPAAHPPIVGLLTRLALTVLAAVFAVVVSASARAEIVVFAAASLQDALADASSDMSPRPRIVHAGSAALARQIEAGAPADVFVTADELWMTRLIAIGLVRAEDVRIVASNRLALIASADGALPAPVGDLPRDFDIRAALGDGRLAIALSGASPAGRYARAALERRGAWTALADRLIETDHVRAALRFVERGEARLGVVYASDAASSLGDVRVLGLFAVDDHPPIRYAAAPLAGADADARAFVDRLAGPIGAAVFARRGFGPPDDGASEAPVVADSDAAAPDAGDAPWLGPAEWEAVALSARVAVVATIASLPVAVGLAFALARGRFWGRPLLDGVVHLPLILPPVVTGYLLLIAFGRQGAIGSTLEAWFGLSFAFRWTGAALAGALMALPLMVRAIRVAIEASDPRLEAAAATLGAGPAARFVAVTLPLIAPGVLAGATLGFAKAMGEFGATITFVSSIPGETRTIPSAIYAFTQIPGGETAAARLVIASVALSFAALFLSEILARRAVRRARGV